LYIITGLVNGRPGCYDCQVLGGRDWRRISPVMITLSASKSGA